MQAIGYFRELPAERPGGDSLAQQNSAFLNYCQREGLEPAATFLDAAHADGDQAGFRQLLSYLQRPDKGFTVVVVADVDRLGGDLRAAASALFQIESLGAQVRLIERPGDSLTHLIAAWAKERNRAGAGDRIRTAMRKKAVKGEVLGRPPYGYGVGPRRRLELVPEEAAIVRYVFRLCLHDDLGIRLIARRLNEEGLKTRRGGNWSMVSIRDILRNRVYLGTYNRLGVRVPGSHPALVSPDDYRRVQDRMSARRTRRPAAEEGPDDRPKRAPFLLSGMVYCGACGNRMIGMSRRQRWRRRTDGAQVVAQYRYYQCESRTNQSMCDYHTRRAAELEAEVRGSIIDGSAERPMLRAGDDQRVKAEAEQLCSWIRSRLSLLDKRMEDYLDDAARGGLPSERLRSEPTVIARDRLALEEELAEAESQLRRQASQAEREWRRNRDLSDVATRWDGLREDRKRALLRGLIDRIVVSDDAVKVLLRP